MQKCKPSTLEAAKVAIEGTWDKNIVAKFTPNEMILYWREMMEGPKIEDASCPNTQFLVLGESVAPVTELEATVLLRELPQLSTGPDGATNADLKRIDPKDLATLLNVVLFLGVATDTFLGSRTILLPRTTTLLTPVNIAQSQSAVPTADCSTSSWPRDSRNGFCYTIPRRRSERSMEPLPTCRSYRQC